MKILVFDNYDSFTYNLVHLIEKVCDHDIEVHRNDKITLEEIIRFDKIVLSPGPGLPSQAGMLIPLIKEYAGKKKILGICLGHQAIAEVFGGKLINLDTVFHGVAALVYITRQDVLFQSFPETFQAGRYHSWIVSKENFPECLEITAVDENNNIMALRHKTLNITGVQFHPESIMTAHGEKMMANWLRD